MGPGGDHALLGSRSAAARTPAGCRPGSGSMRRADSATHATLLQHVHTNRCAAGAAPRVPGLHPQHGLGNRDRRAQGGAAPGAQRLVPGGWVGPASAASGSFSAPCFCHLPPAACLCDSLTHTPCLAGVALQEDEMVSRMLRFRKDMLSVMQHSFAGHADFAQALKEGEPRCLASLGAVGLARVCDGWQG